MTSQKPEEVLHEFGKVRTRQSLIVMVSVGAAVAFGWVNSGHGVPGLSDEVTAVTVFSVFAIAYFLWILNWKCPSCGKSLGKKTNPTHCWSCGVRLQ